jgi:hypothetical protein
MDFCDTPASFPDTSFNSVLLCSETIITLDGNSNFTAWEDWLRRW